MDYFQQSLFERYEDDLKAPLADRVRPRNLDEFVGQQHVLGSGKLLRRLIETDNITSMILWGPPGVGKTTIAMIIAKMTNAQFMVFSAVTSGIKEIKDVMATAKETRMRGIRTVLFVDEIHRFNKAQQDAFLPFVENGSIILIGATTENPSFQVNSALISRSKVFVLKQLEVKDVVELLKNAINSEKGYGNIKVKIEDEVLSMIALYSNGDARTALNILEMAVLATIEENGIKLIDRELVEDCIQNKALIYDKNGEEHYNLISALHKSMRNSDPDASVYWLARMLEAGEDPLYVGRRLIRFASEDVGLADPKALQIVVACYDAVRFIGMPECSVNLTHAVVYLALAPKSNSLYVGYKKAKIDALKTIAEGVPMQLRNAPTKLMENLGYGDGYQYAHNLENKVANMQCLPDNLVGEKYYVPTNQGVEKSITERLEYLNKLRSEKK